MERPLSDEIARNILESAPDSMVIVDAAGKIVSVNSQTERVFGYDRGDLVGRPIEQLLPERYRTKHVAQRDGYFKSPHIRPMAAALDLFGARKDGSEFPVEISLSPLRTAAGLLVTAAVRDVSERKRIEKELIQAREAADKANRAKSEFLANMSHEIRTPLAGILGYAEMLIHYGKSDEQRRDYAGKIKRSADNLTEIINEILDLSKVEAGALKVERLRFSPTSELEQVLTLFQPQAEQKGVTLEVVVERPVPEFLHSDPTRFRQILTNLIGNALKFTDAGKVAVRVRKAGSSKLAFVVTDTGCGISAAAQTRLFQPFTQADSSTSRKYGGSGLGLALSRRLAKLLGGDVELTESAEGKGSSFTFTIAVTEAKGSTEAGTTADQVGAVMLQGVRVLLAEDVADNAQLVITFLEGQSASVDLAKNGEEAVKLWRAGKYDVILMDLQMPVLDGYAATRKLREEGCRLPVIALTAHAMVEEERKSREAGCNAFLTKPIDFARLIQTVSDSVRDQRK